jgi:bleomycin hydrolase
MLVYGLSKDKKGADYLVAKNTCTSGDGELNLSEAYVKLNTVFLLLNKNSLPADLKVKLGL